MIEVKASSDNDKGRVTLSTEERPGKPSLITIGIVEKGGVDKIATVTISRGELDRIIRAVVD